MTPLQLSFRGPLVGTLTLPGDKSVSHRAVLFNLLASGRATVNGLLRSEDVEASMRAARALGAVIDEHDDEVWAARDDGRRHVARHVRRG